MDIEKNSYHSLIGQIHKDWALLSDEVTKSGIALETAQKQAHKPPVLSREEQKALDAHHRADADVNSHVATSSVSGLGAATIVIETLVEILGGDKTNAAKKKGKSDEDDILVNTSLANRREAQKAGFLSPVRTTPKPKSDEPEPKSVFADFMINPEQERLRQENMRQKRALLGAQRRDLELALEKHGTRQRTQQDVLAARRQHQLKLEQLGLIPKGLASGPRLSNPFEIRDSRYS